MKKFQVLLNSINESIVKNWFWLHIIFIVFYVIYVAYKVVVGFNPISSDPDITSDFNLMSFIFVVIGFLIITIPFTFIKLKIYWLYVIAFIAYLMISFGHIRTVDKELSWEGSDVAWGNYTAAEEFNKFGILQGINDWNERANPYTQDLNSEYCDSVKETINKFNLSWITFDKWKTSKMPRNYESGNNRPIMHPPLGPIVLGVWLTIFPFGHWSAEIFMILLEFASIILIFVLFRRGFKNDDRIRILLITLITTSVMIRFHNPSAEQLSMLLFLLSTYFIFDIQKLSPFKYFLSGLLIGLTFYTKFNIIFYIIVQVFFFLFNDPREKLKSIIFYLSGILTVVFVFTVLGYYYWLTFLTGYIYSKLYALYHPLSIAGCFSKILYFGPTILLLMLLLITEINKNNNKKLLTSILLSLAITIIYLWDIGTWHRYLVFYLPVLFTFLLISKRDFSFKTKELLIIPITNFIFIVLNIYF